MAGRAVAGAVLVLGLGWRRAVASLALVVTVPNPLSVAAPVVWLAVVIAGVAPALDIVAPFVVAVPGPHLPFAATAGMLRVIVGLAAAAALAAGHNRVGQGPVPRLGAVAGMHPALKPVPAADMHLPAVAAASPLPSLPLPVPLHVASF